MTVPATYDLTGLKHLWFLQVALEPGLPRCGQRPRGFLRPLTFRLRNAGGLRRSRSLFYACRVSLAAGQAGPRAGNGSECSQAGDCLASCEVPCEVAAIRKRVVSVYINGICNVHNYDCDHFLSRIYM